MTDNIYVMDIDDGAAGRLFVLIKADSEENAEIKANKFFPNKEIICTDIVNFHVIDYMIIGGCDY